MKHLKYILIPALTGLMFTSCNTEPTGPSQAELDTQVEAKIKSATDQLKSDCDARMMQAAQLKADSIMAKMPKMQAPRPVAAPKPAAPVAAPKPVTTKTKVTPKPKETTKSKTVEGGGLRSQSDASKAKDKKAVEGGGLRSQSDGSKAKDNKAVEGGGLRSQSDQNREKK